MGILVKSSTLDFVGGVGILQRNSLLDIFCRQRKGTPKECLVENKIGVEHHYGYFSIYIFRSLVRTLHTYSI